MLCESTEEARDLARKLDEQNKDRRHMEYKAFEEADAMVEQNPEIADCACIVIASADWHPGIIGPLAARIAEKYSKPAFAIAIGEDRIGKGSGRTVAGIDLHAALKRCEKSLEQYGGHAMAAGITVKETKIDGFRKNICGYLDKLDNLGEISERKRMIDMRIELSDLTLDLAEQTEILEPFGTGNPRPVLLLEGAKIVSHTVIKNSHLKLFLERGESEKPLEAMWWHSADRLENGALAGEKDIIFTPEINTWGENGLSLSG